MIQWHWSQSDAAEKGGVWRRGGLQSSCRGRCSQQTISWWNKLLTGDEFSSASCLKWKLFPVDWGLLPLTESFLWNPKWWIEVFLGCSQIQYNKPHRSYCYHYFSDMQAAPPFLIICILLNIFMYMKLAFCLYCIDWSVLIPVGKLSMLEICEALLTSFHIGWVSKPNPFCALRMSYWSSRESVHQLVLYDLHLKT